MISSQVAQFPRISLTGSGVTQPFRLSSSLHVRAATGWNVKGRRGDEEVGGVCGGAESDASINRSAAGKLSFSLCSFPSWDADMKARFTLPANPLAVDALGGYWPPLQPGDKRHWLGRASGVKTSRGVRTQNSWRRLTGWIKNKSASGRLHVLSLIFRKWSQFVTFRWIDSVKWGETQVCTWNTMEEERKCVLWPYISKKKRK